MKDRLIDAIAQAHQADLGEVLAGYSRDRLKELCRALGLPDSGKEKAAIAQRLLAPEEEEKEEEKETVRAKLRTLVRRKLRKYGYPPGQDREGRGV